MKYVVRTTVNAVLLTTDGTECATEVAGMLENTPHRWSTEGLYVSSGGVEEELIEMGNFIMFDTDGRLLVIEHDAFLKNASPLEGTDGKDS